MIGPLQFSLRHWNLRNLTLHSGILPYKHTSRSLEIFSAWLAHWQSLLSSLLPFHKLCMMSVHILSELAAILASSQMECMHSAKLRTASGKTDSALEEWPSLVI